MVKLLSKYVGKEATLVATMEGKYGMEPGTMYEKYYHVEESAAS